MTITDRLQAWAGPGFGINPWHDVAVKDVELYYAANTVEYKGIAVVAGTTDPLTGADGFRACVQHGITDPAQQASLAMLFFAGGGKPLTDGAAATGERPDVRALVRPPTVAGGALVFWALDQRGELLVRYRLDLSALQLESTPGQALAAGAKSPIDVALEQLAGKSTSLYAGAIDAIVAACTDPRAAPALADVVAKHPDDDARRWAAFQAASCHDGKTADALIAALAHDKAAPVRKAAADSLGKLGAKQAKAALEHAQQDPDVDVRGAAGRALKKL